MGLQDKLIEAQALVTQLSVEEKAAFCSGTGYWHLQGSERLEIPEVMVTDGPHGLRKQVSDADHIGLNTSVPATCFPTASALAASWDPDLLHRVGVALGEQCVAENVAVLLGPGLNIKRHPHCGRNFEYFSEDPLLTGLLATAMIEGVQSQGVGTSIKHFAANNQETARMYVDTIVDERTLREIYLRGFEIAVRKAQPWTVMCAYNRLNGTYCSEHNWLLNEVLRDEWNFEGLVVTDWGATNDRVQGVKSGLDLEMPGNGGANDAAVIDAVHNGRLSQEALDTVVTRNVSLSLLGRDLKDKTQVVDQDAHHMLARKVAAECTVLLKNDDHMLPLRSPSSIAVIGAFAKRPRFQGAGSSRVNPTRVDCAYDAIVEAAGSNASVTYASGYKVKASEIDDSLVAEALAAARNSEVAIVFAGLPEAYESEGFDRTHMDMPEQHNRLIRAVCKTNPNTVVVLSNGSPVTMPWIELPKAILEGYLGGQAGGSAIADVLYGEVNPSGKLAETFPLKQADVPSDPWFPGTGRQVCYREGLYVGYRFFDTANKNVLFPFGHGLSYTQFEYTNLSVTSSNDKVQVALDITNSGERTGAEIVQLYVRANSSAVYRPKQELKAFTKVWLSAGETLRIELALDDSAFEVYDPSAKTWVVESGTYEIRVGASSRDIRLIENLNINRSQQLSPYMLEVTGPELGADGLIVGEDTFAAMLGRTVPAPDSLRPFHWNSSLSEIEVTWLGKKFKSKVIAAMQEQAGVSATDETFGRMLQAIANEMPLRFLVLMHNAPFSPKMLDILIACLNRRVGTAILRMFRK